ncbi:MAG: hypothetical protein UT01_C0024G0004 [Candidatus Daviesbacteria bacterium GW2011_GWA1_38_7]|nr:MAG: hypothetical protein UT01_C0024G0004 [Candidatus Daviesbacteria bacterium GW2011_GWA1_38_7]
MDPEKPTMTEKQAERLAFGSMSSPKPEGGSNFKVTSSPGDCKYILNTTSLKPFYLSLYKDK